MLRMWWKDNLESNYKGERKVIMLKYTRLSAYLLLILFRLASTTTQRFMFDKLKKKKKGDDETWCIEQKGCVYTSNFHSRSV